MKLHSRLDRIERALGPENEDPERDLCQCERPAVTVNWDTDPAPPDAGGLRREVCATCGLPYLVRVLTWGDIEMSGYE